MWPVDESSVSVTSYPSTSMMSQSSAANQKAWSSILHQHPSSVPRMTSNAQVSSPTASSITNMSARSSLRQYPTSSFSMNRSRVDAASRVKVSVRVRPPFSDEIQAADNFYLTVNVPEAKIEGKFGNVILGRPNSDKQRSFVFDHTFSPATSQAEIYSVIAEPIVSDVLRGVNGTIFAYGQTGTGKTYVRPSRRHLG